MKHLLQTVEIGIGEWPLTLVVYSIWVAGKRWLEPLSMTGVVTAPYSLNTAEVNIHVVLPG